MLRPTRPGLQVGRLPFGDSYICRLPYTENSFISASGTTGLTALGYTYRGNNMYDPRVQVGGNQPMQYDLLSLVYNQYIVLETHVELTFSNPSHDGMWVGYRVRSSTNPVATSGQTLSYIQEMDHTHARPLNNSGSQNATFRFAFRTATIIGVSELMVQDFQMSAPMAGTAGPGIEALIEPFAVHTISGEDAVVRYQVSVTYHARLFERKTYPES